MPLANSIVNARTIPPATHLTTGDIVDRYEVLGLLGEGGIAKVYRVRHRGLGSLHALKVLAIHRPSVQQRAVREGKVQAGIRHPNVVSVTDIVTCQGSPALVLEYVAGPALDEFLDARRLPLAEVDLIARGILKGVAHAHEQGVVHRDLKPANILLELVEDTLVPRVTDFGIAKLLAVNSDALRTQAGAMMGTPGYMPPEQFLDASQVDTRADVWALGVLLYELCTHRSPFPTDEPIEAHRRVSVGDYAPPEAHVPNLPRRMADAIRAALQPHRHARPSDAAALLALWTNGEPPMTDVCCATTLATAFAHRPKLRQTPSNPVTQSTLRSRARPALTMWLWPIVVVAIATLFATVGLGSAWVLLKL